jgi:hypothetical protein
VIVNEAAGTDSLSNDDVHTVPRMPSRTEPSLGLNISLVGPLQKYRQRKGTDKLLLDGKILPADVDGRHTAILVWESWMADADGQDAPALGRAQVSQNSLESVNNPAPIKGFTNAHLFFPPVSPIANQVRQCKPNLATLQIDCRQESRVSIDL